MANTKTRVKKPAQAERARKAAPARQPAKADLLIELERLRRTSQGQREALKEARRRLEAVEAAGQAFLLADAKGRVLDSNDAFHRASGLSAQEVLGADFLSFCLFEEPDKTRAAEGAEPPEATALEIREALDSTGHWEGEVVFGSAAGKGFPAWLSASALRSPSGRVRNYTATFLDVTSFKLTENRLVEKAHYDLLTKLPNRALMLDRFGQALSLARRNQYPVGVMLLDLDRFKDVNDSLGHHVGDQLLVEAAARLTGALRDSDTVARMGGDEFLIILPDIGGHNNAAHIAQKLLDRMCAPFRLAGHEVFISASLGIAVYPTDGTEQEPLVKCADTAMYHAKAQGKNNFKFFTEDINKSTLERFMLENRFRQALDKLEFHLNYQPKVDMRTGRISGMEALLRWYHPDQGHVRPALFIPLAEETGLVVQLGEWALREACRQNRAWQEEGLRPLRVSVNLSPRQFRKRALLDIVKGILHETGLSPEHLMLEVTESSLVDSIEETLALLKDLREVGVGVSIDDFGTGYSSLNYLNRFTLDELKVDKAFIADLTSEENRKVVSAIVALAHGLNHKVVAEGVETPEQLAFLQTLGCNEAQGYLFSHPLSAEDFGALLAKDPVFPLP